MAQVTRCPARSRTGQAVFHARRQPVAPAPPTAQPPRPRRETILILCIVFFKDAEVGDRHHSRDRLSVTGQHNTTVTPFDLSNSIGQQVGDRFEGDTGNDGHHGGSYVRKYEATGATLRGELSGRGADTRTAAGQTAAPAMVCGKEAGNHSSVTQATTGCTNRRGQAGKHLSACSVLPGYRYQAVSESLAAGPNRQQLTVWYVVHGPRAGRRGSMFQRKKLCRNPFGRGDGRIAIMKS